MLPDMEGTRMHLFKFALRNMVKDQKEKTVINQRTAFFCCKHTSNTLLM